MEIQTTRCIVHCITPIHLISALSAIQTLHPEGNVRVTVIEHWPGLGAQPLQELLQAIIALSQNSNIIQKRIGLDQETLNALIALEWDDMRLKLQMLTGEEACDEIYYPHDNTGSLYQLLCTLYPRAKRVCFGDGLGTVYEKKFQRSLFDPSKFLKLLQWPAHFAYTLLHRLSKGTVLRSVKEKQLQKSFSPNVAVLILPTDHSGNFLRSVPLRVVPKHIFLDILQHCTTSATAFAAAENTLVADAQQKLYLLLTNNFTESGLIEYNQEIAMWCAVIREHCVPHSTIILKNHPGEKISRNTEIQKALGQDYRIVWLDPKYNRYPVELMETIIQRATVICFSASMLSIKYAFNKDCVNPFSSPFIEKWFPKSKKLVLNALQLYSEPLARLDSWDGKSLIWSPVMNERRLS